MFFDGTRPEADSLMRAAGAERMKDPDRVDDATPLHDAEDRRDWRSEGERLAFYRGSDEGYRRGLALAALAGLIAAFAGVVLGFALGAMF